MLHLKKISLLIIALLVVAFANAQSIGIFTNGRNFGVQYSTLSSQNKKGLLIGLGYFKAKDIDKFSVKNNRGFTVDFAFDYKVHTNETITITNYIGIGGTYQKFDSKYAPYSNSGNRIYSDRANTVYSMAGLIGVTAQYSNYFVGLQYRQVVWGHNRYIESYQGRVIQESNGDNFSIKGDGLNGLKDYPEYLQSLIFSVVLGYRF